MLWIYVAGRNFRLSQTVIAKIETEHHVTDIANFAAPMISKAEAAEALFSRDIPAKSKASPGYPHTLLHGSILHDLALLGASDLSLASLLSSASSPQGATLPPTPLPLHQRRRA